MFHSIKAIAIAAVATAGVMAGLTMILTSVVPEARAESRIIGAVNEPQAKGDRLAPRPTGDACSARGWPNYEQGCQFDLRRAANEVRTVRVIALR